MFGHCFEEYIKTLNRCGVFLLDLSDKEIGYNIFEEFDIGVIAFLYYKNIDLFKKVGFIDEIIAQKSIELSSKVMDLKKTKLWNIESFKTTNEWLEIMHLSDEIKCLIKDKWSDSELQSLFDLELSDFGIDPGPMTLQS